MVFFMKHCEVLVRIPGLTPRELYYFEQQGYISPEHIDQGLKRIRNYSEKDVELVELIHRNISKGMTPKEAYRSALSYLKDPAWRFKELLSSTVDNAHKAILEGAEVIEKKGYPVLEKAMAEARQDLGELSPTSDTIIEYVDKGCQQKSH